MNIRKLKYFNYEDELESLERPIKKAWFAKYAGIPSYHEWVTLTIVQYKPSATLKITY